MSRMRKINEIIIHCSDSNYGNKALINKWHLERGWDCIGYHYVINNCYKTYNDYMKKSPDIKNDGNIEIGRPEHIKGAHCMSHNAKSIGICLIGTRNFTGNQITSLYELMKRLICKYGKLEISGHYKYNNSKTCPNIDIEILRIKFADDVPSIESLEEFYKKF